MSEESHPYDLMIEKGYNPINDAIISFLSKRVIGKFLDVGCNVGCLLEEVPNGTGIDFSKKVVARAQEKGLNVIFGRAEKLPFENKSFDTVVLSSVLEQTPNWKLAFKEALRVGKKVIGINPFPGKSQWGRLGENPWIKSIIDPTDLPGAKIEAFNEFLYYFELESPELESPELDSPNPSEKTAKLLLGGLMLGDTFHIIPFLNKLLREGITKLFWVTGTYEKTAVEFLQQFYPIKASYFDDGSPADLSARFRFTKQYGQNFNSIQADTSIQDVEASLCSGSFEQDRGLYLLNNIHLLDSTPENSIILHPQTVHDWKKVPGIGDANWSRLGASCYTVGHSNEFLIPGTIDFRGRSFFEVAQKIVTSRLVVGIHSAIACLTLYLGKPMLVCHPWRDSRSPFLHFGYFRNSMKDIHQPSPDEIVELARKMLNGEYVQGEASEKPKELKPEDQREVIEANSLAELAEKL